MWKQVYKVYKNRYIKENKLGKKYGTVVVIIINLLLVNSFNI